MSLLLAFFCIEFTLRKVWGFGEMVLFQEDKNFEYLQKANQNQVRFGNRIFYNEYSMRSEPLTSSDSCIILGFGDSVINGGTLTDQDSLATTMVERELNAQRGGGLRFLNISAGSWGPDNCAGYVKKYGAFNAQMIVLFVSSHDAHDNMTFEKTVGYHESYPNKQYPLALMEVISRYLLPRIAALFNKDEPNDLMINKNGIGFNPGFEFFRGFVKDQNIPFLICLHADKSEVQQGSFNAEGREIIDYCQANNIKLISGIQIGEDLSHYRDDIHINEKGQKLWKKVLEKEIQETIECAVNKM